MRNRAEQTVAAKSTMAAARYAKTRLENRIDAHHRRRREKKPTGQSFRVEAGHQQENRPHRKWMPRELSYDDARHLARRPAAFAELRQPPAHHEER